MRHHYSAGGVVINSENQLYLIHKIARDEWALPKGRIGAGESPLQAAKREVQEETGISNVETVSEKPIDIVGYTFTREGQTEPERKTVHIFLFKTDNPSRTETEEMKKEGLGGKWLDFEKAIQITQLKDVKETLRKAKRKLEEQEAPACYPSIS